MKHLYSKSSLLLYLNILKYCQKYFSPYKTKFFPPKKLGKKGKKPVPVIGRRLKGGAGGQHGCKENSLMLAFHCASFAGKGGI